MFIGGCYFINFKKGIESNCGYVLKLIDLIFWVWKFGSSCNDFM